MPFLDVTGQDKNASTKYLILREEDAIHSWVSEFRELNQLSKESEACYSTHQGGPRRYPRDGESTTTSSSGSKPLGWAISACLVKVHLKQK